MITLAFDVPGMTSSLKTIDITISKDDSWSMIKSGQNLLEVVDGQKNSVNAKVPRPFTRALTHYVDAHLSLKLDDPRVKISRVACGAFVLGTEGKIKLSTPPSVSDDDDVQSRATKALLAGLIDLATGGKVVAMVDLT